MLGGPSGYLGIRPALKEGKSTALVLVEVEGEVAQPALVNSMLTRTRTLNMGPYLKDTFIRGVPRMWPECQVPIRESCRR